MFCYNDNWFMNESLAFYMSTNTFSNPIFDAQVEQNHPTIQNDYHQNELEATTNTSATRKHHKHRNEPHYEMQSGLTKKQRCSAFCDSLVFSFKSKMYVFELNFKRKLQSLKRLARKRLPWIFPDEKRMGRDEKYGTRIAAGYECNNNNNNYEEDRDTFWKNIEPDSRKSLGLQQEKILYRLERVLQAKRSSQQLFNMDQPEKLNNGFRYIRPIDSDQRTSLSPSPRSSSLSSSNATSYKVQNGSTSRKKRKQRKPVRWMSSGRRQTRDVANEITNSKKLCIVCYTNSPNIVTLPCKHHDICSDCFIEIIYMAVKHSRYPLKCVLCRQKIERIRCSRRLLLSVIEKNRIHP